MLYVKKGDEIIMISIDGTNGDFWANLKKKKEEEARQREQEQKQRATDSNTTPPAPVTSKLKPKPKKPKQKAKPQEKKKKAKPENVPVKNELTTAKDSQISLRLSTELRNRIDRLAKQFGLTLSATCRLAIERNLADYFGNILFIDDETAKEIDRRIIAIFNELQAIKNEANRIGVNINQRTKQLNKISKTVDDVNEILPQIKSEIWKQKNANQKAEMIDLYRDLKDSIERIETEMKNQKYENEFDKLNSKIDLLCGKVAGNVWRTVASQEHQKGATH